MCWSKSESKPAFGLMEGVDVCARGAQIIRNMAVSSRSGTALLHSGLTMSHTCEATSKIPSPHADVNVHGMTR